MKIKTDGSGAKESRKRELAIAGLKVFCEKGFDGATIEDIVKKAGCSHGLFYHYFKNKNEVFDDTMRIHREKNSAEIDKQLEKEKNYVEKLRIIINNMFYDLKNDENFAYFYYFFVSQCFTCKEKKLPSRDDKQPPPEPPIMRLEKLFAEGQAAGDFSDKHSPKDCARLFISIIQGATLGYVIAPKELQKRMTLPDTDFILEIFSKERLNEK